MKKILAIAVTILVFFVIGAVGTYFTIPKVFPEKVAVGDSLAVTADSLEALASVPVSPALEELPDSIAFAMAVLDSMLATHGDSLSVDLGEMLPSVISMLRDSLEAVHTSRESLAAERDSALSRVRTLEQELAGAIIPDGDAASVAKTLAGMDDKQLLPILRSISDNALAALYHTASARDKRRLIGAMPSERAVRLVQNQLASNEASNLTNEAKADSASTPQ